MKRYLAVLTALALSTLLCSCGRPAPSPTPAGDDVSPAVTEQTGETVSPDESGDYAPGEDDVEQTPPPQTPWVEPDKVDYAGKYLDLANDKDIKKYPSLTVDQSVETGFGMMKLPRGWTMQEGDAGSVLFADENGNVLGTLYQIDCYKTEPYFELLPMNAVPMLWGKPQGFAGDARALVADSEYPTSADEVKQTIIRVVSLLSGDSYADEDGREYFIATCFCFDKAYVDGNKIQNVMSNQAIDEIAKSLVLVE